MKLWKLILACSIFAASLAHAANPAFVKSGSIVNNTSSPGGAGSFTPTTAGDSLLLILWSSGTGTWGAVTNSQSSVIQDCATAHYAYLRVASAVSSAQTFSISYSTFTSVHALIVEVSNLGAFDKCATEATAIGTSVASNFVTPAANDEFLLGGVITAAGSLTLSSWTNSFTQDKSSTGGPSLADAYLVQTTGPTSVNVGVTLSASETWFAMLAAYRPPGGSGPTPQQAASLFFGGG
jgi:hypothetical protein